MKQRCAIVRDLYILYEENSIAEESKSYVEKHIAECKSCKEYYEKMQNSMEFAEDVGEIIKEKESNKKEEKRIKKSFRKIRQRWIASLVVIAVMVPIVGVGARLTINQIDGYGLKFTNLSDVKLCKEFFQALQNGEYYAASKMLAGKTEDYYEWKEWLDAGTKKYEGEKFLLNGEEWYMLDNSVEGIVDEEEYWKDAIHNYKQGVLIPEEIWEEYVPNQKMVLWNANGVETQYYFLNQEEAENAKKEKIENKDFDKGFVKLDTEWGIYYINYFAMGKAKDDGYDIMYRFDNGEKGSIALCECCAFVPDRIVEDANVQLGEFYEEQKAWFEETYGDLSSLSEEQVEEYFATNTAEQLETFFSSGFTIEKIIYSDDEQIPIVGNEDFYDNVERISIVMKNEEGELEEGCFTLAIKDGKIHRLELDTNSEQMRNMYEIMIHVKGLAE